MHARDKSTSMSLIVESPPHHCCSVRRRHRLPVLELVMSTVSPYIKAGDVDLVFKLRLKDGLTAVQLSKIPEQLLGESEVDRFLRIIAVTSQKATLALYHSRARAVEDNRGELLAPMVSAATLSVASWRDLRATV